MRERMTAKRRMLLSLVFLAGCLLAVEEASAADPAPCGEVIRADGSRALLRAPEGAATTGGAGLAILEIEVNQVLGGRRDGTGFALAKDFVAGKDTVVRVYLSQEVIADPEKGMQTVTVSRGDAQVAVLKPAASAAPTKVLTFSCPSRGACGDWAEGTYKFAASVDGAVLARENVLLETRRNLRILAVPIKGNYGGNIKTPDDKWKQGASLMRSVYPVSYAGLVWDNGNMLDLSDPKYDLLTKEGGKAVWLALNDLQPRECLSNPKGSNCYDAIIGFVKENMGGLQGYTYGPPSNVVVNDDQDMLATVCHEVAHLYGIADEYKGGHFRCSVNPPPKDYVGKDWDNNQPVSCTNSITLEGNSGEGSLCSGTGERPFEVGGRGALGDMTSWMGSGGTLDKYWTTADIWAWMYKEFKPASADAPRLSDPLRVVEASGWVSRATGAVTAGVPWYSGERTVPVHPGQGSYTIQALSHSGEVLGYQHFTPDFYPHTNPPVVLEEAPFTGVVVPFPQGTVKFRIVSEAGTPAEVNVYPHEPEIQSVQVAAGSSPDQATVSWTASHPDGAPLYYDVEYSPTGQDDDFEVLASGIQQTSFTANLADLPGGTAAVMQVTATDGVNAVAAASEPFQVACKAPEPYIESLTAGESYVDQEEVALEGAANDLQDEVIYEDDRLSWSSDVDGVLGTGPMLFVSGLTPGDHVITLTATNSCGIAATKSVPIKVIASPTVTDVSKGSNWSLKVRGGGFVNGLSVFLGSSSTPWANVVFKNDSLIVIKGAKSMFPPGTSVPIRIINPDGGFAITSFTR